MAAPAPLSAPAVGLPPPSSSSASLSKIGVIRLDAEYKHEGRLRVQELFAAAAAQALGRSDFTQPLKILSSHLVETVSDLRLLVMENQLRDLGLPIRLCVWIEDEVAKLAAPVAAINVQQPAGNAANAAAAAPTPLPPIPLSAPVRARHVAASSSSAASNGGAAASPALAGSSSVAAAAAAAAVASGVPSASSPDKVAIFQYHSDFDQYGLLYYLGSRGGTAPWSNPADLGHVAVTASGLGKDSAPLSAIVGRQVVRCVTNSGDASFIQIELKNFYCKPTNYTLRHYASYDTECLRDWKLEGSVDGANWVLLKEHLGDCNLNAKGGTCTWNVLPDDPANHDRQPSLPGGAGAGAVALQQSHLLTPSVALSSTRHWYRFFKVTMLGPNSNAHLYLACSGIELYGYVVSSAQMDAWKAAGGSVAAIPPFMAANYPPWPLPRDGVLSIQQHLQVGSGGVSARGQGALAAAAAVVSPSADDVNSTLSDESEEKAPLSLLADQLANLSFTAAAADGARGHGLLSAGGAAAAAAAASGAHGLSALGSAGLYTYSSDFDKNGIIWALGTRNHTTPWSNPVETGLVRIHSSSLMEDSAPLSAIVGRDTVRCVTKPIPNSWIVLDFLEDKRVHLTHYSFKHYSSWDTECLRCWRLEASLTGAENEWHCLREHTMDENLNGKGGTFTWSVAAPDAHRPFRFLRIIQTAENSNKHHYLALSGIELYGRLLAADGLTPYNFAPYNYAPAPSSSGALAVPSAAAAAAAAAAGPLVAPPAVGMQHFKYHSDFDRCGVLYWLATGGFTRSWSNPADSGLVKLYASSLNDDSEPLSSIVGQSVVRCVTQPVPDQWMALDFGPGRLIQPTAYSLRHYASWDTEALRNWRFQASTDGGDPMRAHWVTLSEHRDDEHLNCKGATHTWHLATTRFFRMFRVFQFDKNSNKHHYLALSGIEIYGNLKTDPSVAMDPQLGPVAQPAVAAAAAAAAASFPLVPPRPAPAAISAVGASHMAAIGGVAPSAFSAPIPAALAPSLPLAPAGGIGMGVGVGVGAAPSPLLDSWDPEARGAFLSVGGAPYGSLVRNTGSSDKWQLCRSTRAYSSGVHTISVRVAEDPNTTNTWRFIVGVVPSSLDCRGPKQWVGVSNSWGYISGTGGKCHTTATSVPYGAKWGRGDIVTVLLNFDAHTVSFFRNDEAQGVAFTDLAGPVHLAASLTATESALQIVDTPPAVTAQVAHLVSFGGAGIAGAFPASMSASASGASLLSAWDGLNKSSALVIDPANGILRNSGSSDKWQSCRSLKPFSGAGGVMRHRFDIELVEAPKTNNSWQVIVGVVPPTFTCSGTKQWVGAGDSWGYIGGTGGKCFNVPKSTEYGEKFGRAGDVIGVQLDFGAGTIEFLRNGVSQGVAFTNLSGTVYAAVSLTATGASAKLHIRA